MVGLLTTKNCKLHRIGNWKIPSKAFICLLVSSAQHGWLPGHYQGLQESQRMHKKQQRVQMPDDVDVPLQARQSHVWLARRVLL